jgi:hypothetical protein
MMIGCGLAGGLAGCKKAECKDTDVTTYVLNHIELGNVRYDGNDSLIFSGHTYKTRQRQYFNTASDPAKCEGAYKKLEGREIVLKDSIARDSIFHNQYVTFGDEANTTFTVSYKGINFTFPYRRVVAPYTKSMIIAGKSYEDVYMQTGNDLSDSLYYSLDKGIIRIVLSSKGKTLQLEE